MPKITDAELGDRLRAIRESVGLSQSALARLLGTHQPGIQRTESGERKIGLLEAIDHCAALGVTLESLVGDATASDDIRRRGEILARIEELRAQL